MASDERLVGAVRSGRVDAFETIFDRYQRQILSFCRHMLGSREEAEDAVQQTFVSAYTDLVNSEKPIQLRPWLYTIARNQCLSILRARRPQAALEDAEPSVEGLAAAVQRREDLRAILRDLSRLPDDQRAALLLSELGALSHEEIADVVGCPKGKVKALVFQARSSLAASRDARDISCEEIREQLSTLTGAALRRAHLRRHLDECLGCRQFQAEVKRQRRAMAIVLPVAPTAALKSGLMSAVAVKAGAAGVAAGAGASGTAATGGVSAILAKAGATKLIVAASIAAVGAGGTVVAVEAVKHGKPHNGTHPPSGHTGSGTGSAAGGGAAGAGSANGTTPSGVDPTRAGGAQAVGKQAGGVANGQNPVTLNGHSETAPGQTGTTPGLAGTSPGKAGTTPGKSESTPGHTKTKTKTGGKGHSKGTSGSGGNGNAKGHTKTKAPKTNGSSGGGGGGSGGGSTSGQGGSGGSSGTKENSGSGSAGGDSGASHGQGKSNAGGNGNGNANGHTKAD